MTRPGWRELAIGECITSVRTTNPREVLGDDEFEYVDLGAVDQQSKAITQPARIKGTEAPSRARQVVAAGDILVSTVRPNLNAVARVGQDLDGAIASTGFCVLRPTERLDGGYLFHWVRSPSFVAGMVRRATGASYPAVSDRIVRDSTLPLPPLDEQRRIAQALNAADALRARRAASVDLAAALRYATFLADFGEPRTAHERWASEPLDRCCVSINDCPHSTPIWSESGVACIRTSNLSAGDWNWSDRRYVTESSYRDRSRRGELAEGDIVLSREGTLGVAAIIPEGLRACLGQRLVQVRLDPTRATPRYLLAYLLWALRPDRISHVLVGSTSRHLNVRDLRSLQVPLPPIVAQRHYAGTVASIEARVEGYKRARNEANALFASLQHRAFTGAL